ncbi:Rnase Y domain-containing protein, partial [Ruminococcaceae bacterium OttesenSCG-928-I18]|nr:Rnase Y domain-containing protein [Ruminococcaceae bacterium OttesenSCG-928-I18]
MLPIWIPIVVAVVGILAAILTFRAGISYRRRTAEQAIGSAEEEAKKIVNDAIKNAEQKLKEATVEA